MRDLAPSSAARNGPALASPPGARYASLGASRFPRSAPDGAAARSLRPGRELLTLLTLLPLVACSQGSPGGVTEGSDSSKVFVQFTTTSLNRLEESENLKFRLELDRVSKQNVVVHFETAGTLGAFSDYDIPAAGQVTIPAGAISTDLHVNVFEDLDGELDEYLQIKLIDAGDANLGVQTTTLLTILDDDGVPFVEIEPNETPTTANLPGAIDYGIRYEVSGDIAPTVFDFFRVDAAQTCKVNVSLNPLSSSARIALNVVDHDGNLIAYEEANFPGASVTGTWPLAIGKSLHLGVAVVNEPTPYVMDVTGTN